MEHLMTFENYTFGREEFVEVKNPQTGKSVILRAKIDTETYTSNIDYKVALELGLNVNGERRVYNILGDQQLKTADVEFTFSTGDIEGKHIQTEVTIADRGKLRNQIAIGRKDLEKLHILIDVKKHI